MKYKKGDRVRILTGHVIWELKEKEINTIELSPDQIGRVAIIQYSHAEKYHSESVDDYAVVFEDNGEYAAWKKPSQMQLIERAKI